LKALKQSTYQHTYGGSGLWNQYSAAAVALSTQKAWSSLLCNQVTTVPKLIIVRAFHTSSKASAEHNKVTNGTNLRNQGTASDVTVACIASVVHHPTQAAPDSHQRQNLPKTLVVAIVDVLKATSRGSRSFANGFSSAINYQSILVKE
jgi:hypothetical protein